MHIHISPILRYQVQDGVHDGRVGDHADAVHAVVPLDARAGEVGTKSSIIYHTIEYASRVDSCELSNLRHRHIQLERSVHETSKAIPLIEMCGLLVLSVNENGHRPDLLGELQASSERINEEE